LLEKGMSGMLQLGENSFLGGYAVSNELPGVLLFLMDQAIYMEWRLASLFTVETVNLHRSVLRWTLR
jgi:hypothetical protein